MDPRPRPRRPRRVTARPWRGGEERAAGWHRRPQKNYRRRCKAWRAPWGVASRQTSRCGACARTQLFRACHAQASDTRVAPRATAAQLTELTDKTPLSLTLLRVLLAFLLAAAAGALGAASYLLFRFAPQHSERTTTRECISRLHARVVASRPHARARAPSASFQHRARLRVGTPGPAVRSCNHALYARPSAVRRPLPR